MPKKTDCVKVMKRLAELYARKEEEPNYYVHDVFEWCVDILTKQEEYENALEVIKELEKDNATH